MGFTTQHWEERKLWLSSQKDKAHPTPQLLKSLAGKADVMCIHQQRAKIMNSNCLRSALHSETDQPLQALPLWRTTTAIRREQSHGLHERFLTDCNALECRDEIPTAPECFQQLITLCAGQSTLKPGEKQLFTTPACPGLSGHEALPSQGSFLWAWDMP